MPGQPLSGTKVLDLTHALAGPFCTRLLHLAGAEIIKIEVPDVGDDFRARSNFFVMNSGKRSMTIDLRRPEGKEIVYRLAAQAAIVVENFRPGVARKLGIDWEVLRQKNPKLVYCSITGFGSRGPLSDRAAIEWVIQAMAGVTDKYTSPDADPRRGGMAFVDAFSGHVAFSAILAALLERDRSGRGHRVDVSMLEAVLSLQSPMMSGDLSPGTAGATQDGVTPSSGQLRSTMARYSAQDRPIFIAMLLQKWFEAVARIIGRPELISDPRFSDNTKRMEAGLDFVSEINEGLQSRSAMEWEEMLAAAGVPAAAVRSAGEILSHPQITESNLLRTTVGDGGSPRLVLGLPFVIDEREEGPDEGVPGLGVDTDDILAELGYTNDEIEVLHRAKVI